MNPSNPKIPTPVSELPGPKGLPILGNMHQLKINTLHLVFEEWSHIYGPIYTFRAMNHQSLVSADPHFNSQVLKMRPHTFSRFSKIERVSDELNLLGVFSAEGEDWHRQRYVVMQALANKHLRQFFPVIQTVSERLLRRWHLQ